jgi:hypothetical protein
MGMNVGIVLSSFGVGSPAFFDLPGMRSHMP